MIQLSVIVAEDEPLAREKLKRLISTDERLVLVGEASNGREAISLINATRPDLAFLDIKMPGASGIRVMEEVEHKPYVIFTTAFDEYALTAFELHAIDYLLKPFAQNRFDSAVSRLGTSRHPIVERLASAVDDAPLKRLYVRERNKIVVVSVNTISRIEAADDYAEVHSDDGIHLVRIRLKLLAERLDPARFLRIHRSTIICLDRVSEIVSCGNGRYEVTLDDGTVCIASRSGAARLREVIN